MFRTWTELPNAIYRTVSTWQQRQIKQRRSLEWRTELWVDGLTDGSTGGGHGNVREQALIETVRKDRWMALAMSQQGLNGNRYASTETYGSSS